MARPPFLAAIFAGEKIAANETDYQP